MSDRAIVLKQARAAIAVALRTPRALVFTIAFPLLFLILFNSIFIKGGDETGTLPNGLVLSAQAYFTAGIVAYAVSLSTFTTLAVSLPTQRERGQLKRLRGTPSPNAASTIAPFSVVLLAFISGVWIPVDQLPHRLESVGKLFFSTTSPSACRRPSPPTRPAAASTAATCRAAAWALAGAWIAVRRFRWEPQGARD